ncbi:MAG: aminotransferase class I/II-fold pyridoxal phosphate-dependent enzyme [Elusimicrobia bacterium]|nr:aminotransferase class I/II-fold pyridoxal phosphate-dependent enzyme [Elusimicrobiota bacterium]
MIPPPSKKLTNLPPYLFVRLSALKEKAAASGLKVIDMGMGNPDQPSPTHVVEEAARSVREEPWTHRYPQTKGIPELRSAIADWYRRRFQVSLDPTNEVIPLVGSKEGLAHLMFAYLGPGDVALVPSPCYPVHYNGVLLAGAKVHWLPLKEENRFLPDLKKIPAAVARRAKVLILNYPNNPTGAVLENTELLQEAVRFAKKHRCFVLYDNAYSEISFDGYRAPSFLELPDAKKVGVEFHSFSKTYSMAGWRLAWACGNAEIIGHLAKFKSFLDYGVPGFLQKAAVAALNGPQNYVVQAAQLYRRRRDVLCEALKQIGWSVEKPKASMYVWARLPERFRKTGSLAFCEKLILNTGVVVAPGVGFGPYGEGYVRFALIVGDSEIREAVTQIGNFLNQKASKPSSPSSKLLMSA